MTTKIIKIETLVEQIKTLTEEFDQLKTQYQAVLDTNSNLIKTNAALNTKLNNIEKAISMCAYTAPFYRNVILGKL